MRRILACWSMLVCLNPVLAATRGPETRSPRSPRPAGPPLSPEQAQLFAQQLKTTIDLIVKQYARPVPRPELVHAALKGLFVATGASVPANLLADLKKANREEDKVLDLITKTRQQLGNPPPLQGSKALEVGLRAGLLSLDPYSFLTNDDAYSVKNTTFANGVGLELERPAVRGPFRIKTVIPGSPSQVAGIRPGDIITHVNGARVEAMKEAALQQQLLYGGEIKGTSLRVTLVRPGRKKVRKITLKAQEFKAETVFGVERDRDNAWRYFLDRKQKIAYIRLDALKHGTAVDLQQVLAGLQKEGLRGLLLDLRWCPGGLLDEAVDVAALFVGDRNIATIAYRDGRKQTCKRRQVGAGGVTGTFADIPLLVLVNGETRGGGELIAAAIQDYKRGAIAGQRTLGKGSVQNALRSAHGDFHYPFPNVTVRLSVGVFTRSSGKNLQRFATSKDRDEWGVRPDARLEFAVSRELSRKLGEWWLLHSIRPGTSDESLLIDDPDNDAQREFAFKALVKIVAKKNKE
jgi:C-terminal peptidase prc